MKYKTKNRDKVIEFLKSNSDRSYALVDICEILVADGHGKSTVYRIISELVAEGCVKKISDGTSRHCTYQYVGGTSCKSHLHLKCLVCGNIIHLDHSRSENVCRELLAGAGFTLEAGGLLFGECGECKRGCALI